MKLNKFFQEYKFLFLSLLISLVIYHKWLSFDIFAYSDYVFQFSETLKEAPLFGLWDMTGMGMFSLFPWRLLGQNSILYSLFGIFQHDSNVAEKFLVLWPWIVLSCLSSYLLVHKITRSHIGSFVGSLVFCYSSYFLSINSSGHLLLSISAVFIIFSFLFFIRFLEEKKITDAILTSLFLAITGFYDFRNLYIVIFLFFFYFLFHFFGSREHRSFLKESLWAAFPLCIFALLNIYWIFPTLLSGSFSNSVLTRGLFGSHFFHITRALTLFHPFWSGGRIEWFVIQELPPHFWLIPLFAILGIVTNVKNRYIVFFSGVSIVGVLLSKQVGEPFTHIYKFLFERFPGFSAFREASKFYVLISIGYAVLIGGFVSWFAKIQFQKISLEFAKYITIGAISLLFLWNAKPIITGEIQSMFVPRHIHNDYFVYRDFIADQKDFFRVLWAPIAPRWALSTLEQPVLSNVTLFEGSWKPFLDFHSNATTWPQKNTDSFFQKNAEAYFDQSSIRYIATPVDDLANDSDFYFFYGRQENTNIRKSYIEELQKVPWLEQVSNLPFSEVAIFENKNYKPHIYTAEKLDLVMSNVNEFDYESQNETAYMNSRIASDFPQLLSKMSRVIIPIDADYVKLSLMQKEMYQELDARKARKMKAEMDFYQGGYFFKNYTISVPRAGTYTVYIKSDSFLARSKSGLEIKVGESLLRPDISKKVESSNHGWISFQNVSLENKEYTFDVFVNGEIVSAMNRQDIVLVLENDAKDISKPLLEYHRVEGTKYVVNVRGAKSSFPLIFSETYHPKWRITVQKNLFPEFATGLKGENNQGTIENEKLDGGIWYDIFTRKTVLEKNHFQINNFANAWWVDLDELEQMGQITKNSDGSYDFALVLEFGPYKYFYIGLMISIVTLILCILYLLYKFCLWLYNRSKKSLIS